jgi:hypothetical protein
MKIASQHQWKDSDYKPRCEWPGDTLVQWGRSGLVLGRKPYTTAFFEAFPDESLTGSGGFIRGEGATLEEAEDKAFAKFTREIDCNHLWGRETYTNGGQLCRHCRAFRSGHIQPLVKLGEWRKPLESWEASCLDMETGDPYLRKLRLRASVFGVKETSR